MMWWLLLSAALLAIGDEGLSLLDGLLEVLYAGRHRARDTQSDAPHTKPPSNKHPTNAHAARNYSR